MKALVTLVLAAAVLVIPQSANASPATYPDTECASPVSMFCSIDGRRAEGPLFVNYVADNGGQQFCVLDRRSTPVQTCHPYWPFVNPVVNADQAPASAFTPSRTTVDLRAELDKAHAVNARQATVINAQARKIARLEKRIAKLRHRLHRH